MADAADENGEPEVAECLRFLWKWRLVPDYIYDIATWGGWGLPDAPTFEFWEKMPHRVSKTPCFALGRVLEAWPQHKQLLIDALEPVCTT